MDGSSSLSLKDVLPWVPIAIAGIGNIVSMVRFLSTREKPSKVEKIAYPLCSLVIIGLSIWCFVAGNVAVKVLAAIGVVFAIGMVAVVFRSSIGAMVFTPVRGFRVVRKVNEVSKHPEQRKRILKTLVRIVSCFGKGQEVEAQIEAVEQMLSDPSYFRRAGPADLDKALVSLRIYETLDEKMLKRKRDKVCAAFSEGGLFERYGYGFPSSSTKRKFRLRFDLFRFLTWKDNDVVAELREAMITDCETRFSGKNIEALVYINREDTQPERVIFFEKLASEIGIRDDAVFDYAPKSSVIDIQRLKKLNGKRIVVIDPFMVDDSISSACSALTSVFGVAIEGVAVMFELNGVHNEICTPIAGWITNIDLEGQISIDLDEVH